MRVRIPITVVVAICLGLLPMRSAAAQVLACTASQKATAVAELMFGRKIGDRIGVTQAAWSRFLEREVSLRFPDGLTVVDAAGHWRDQARSRTIREPSKIVTIVLRDGERDHERIEQIVAAYKQRFRQQSVGVILRPACVSF